MSTLVEAIFVAIWGVTMIAWQYSIQQFNKERAEWKAERQMLLDRIQAPSFAEYTAKVVREKKLEKEEEKEQNIEFVS